ncbi:MULTISPECIES: response regulator [Burkholderia]|uniref:Two-component system response regulator n=1 Tax=Burkholderia mayonis TaxID=1385591 RepID=A0A1B4FE88_9BURK|nr:MULTISPECIES: response regulator [Burkholderia]AOJ01872.1 two-component system response regulator [Burkholderia mayonis]KVE43223.1 two-component system response regulator [Burkholderia sp. BDU5]KVE47267.1 two-component system response regulator [Burkholderia mayonis]
MPNATSCPNDIPSGRIIVLDDEAEIRNILQRFLASHGFDVRSARNSTQLDVFLERQPYDLLILDIMMPGEDGLAVCRRLRARGQTIPILMLTARGDPVDRVVGLELGADDYLAKPFLPRELLARVRAMLRRQQVTLRQRDLRDGVLQESGGAILRFGGYQLDTGRQELGGPNGAAVEVGSAEMRLLCALAQTPNRPVSRANLIERARGPNYDANTRSVDVQVLRLRQIIEADASAPRHIRTVWGTGYMLVAELES